MEDCTTAPEAVVILQETNPESSSIGKRWNGYNDWDDSKRGSGWASVTSLGRIERAL